MLDKLLNDQQVKIDQPYIEERAVLICMCFFIIENN